MRKVFVVVRENFVTKECKILAVKMDRAEAEKRLAELKEDPSDPIRVVEGEVPDVDPNRTAPEGSGEVEKGKQEAEDQCGDGGGSGPSGHPRIR